VALVPPGEYVFTLMTYLISWHLF